MIIPMDQVTIFASSADRQGNTSPGAKSYPNPCKAAHTAHPNSRQERLDRSGTAAPTRLELGPDSELKGLEPVSRRLSGTTRCEARSDLFDSPDEGAVAGALFNRLACTWGIEGRQG